MNEKIPVKIIDMETAKKMGLGRKPSFFAYSSVGKIGHNPHDIKIYNMETGEEAFLLKDNIKQDFKGFKNK